MLTTRAPRLVRERAADGVDGLEVAHHPAAAVQVGDGPARALGLVDAHGHAARPSCPRRASTAGALAREVLGLGEVRRARLLDRHLVRGRAVVGRQRVEDPLELGSRLTARRSADQDQQRRSRAPRGDAGSRARLSRRRRGSASPRSSTSCAWRRDVARRAEPSVPRRGARDLRLARSALRDAGATAPGTLALSLDLVGRAPAARRLGALGRRPVSARSALDAALGRRRPRPARLPRSVVSDVRAGLHLLGQAVGEAGHQLRRDVLHHAAAELGGRAGDAHVGDDGDLRARRRPPPSWR